MRKQRIALFLTIIMAPAVACTAAGKAMPKDAEAEERKAAAPVFQFESQPVDRSNTARLSSYADVLEQVRPAVVSVTTARIVRVFRGPSNNPMEELLRRFYGLPSPRRSPRDNSDDVQEQKQPSGLGSGVIISTDGYILTNNHVVSDESSREIADEIEVRLSNQKTYPAKVIGRDPNTDIALLKIEENNLPTVRMADSDNLRVGDIVFAIGNPLGVGQTVTMGIVSATGRSDLGILGNQGYENFIQTDASINPGNSGGALVDAEGRLVGINTAILSRTGGNIGIGFAVPITMARAVAQNLVETGTVRRGFLGVNISNLNPDLAEAFGVPNREGVLIERVEPGLPADLAGLKRGDVVIAINDRSIDSVTALRLSISQMAPGAKATVTILRQGEEKKMSVTLASLDGSLAAGGNNALLEGVTAQAVTSELREEYEIPAKDEGVVVTEVAPRSAFSNVLRPGMLIIEINDQPTPDLQTARQALRSSAVNKLWVFYRGNLGFVALRLP